VAQRNLDNLTIWHNVGADVENGLWAMAGSRMGTYMTMLTNWDYRQVQDFSELVKLWDTVKDTHPDIVSGRVCNDLHTQLSLPICTLSAEGSEFFKHHYRANWQNKGVMERET
jgi:hypothetical protein